MDLWDVLKLTIRRWYIAVPILVLTAAAAGLALLIVKPEYVGTTSVILLPPTARTEENPATAINPWDPRSLSLATLTYINSKQLHDEFKVQGLSDVWAADLDQRSSSLILIEITGDTPERTLATASALQARIESEVVRLQQPYNLSLTERVTTIPFDSGKNLLPSTSKSKRTLIVVVVLGLIITIGTTVAVDALMRRRIRRQAAASDFVGPSALPAAGPVITPLPLPVQLTQRPSDPRLASPVNPAPSVELPTETVMPAPDSPREQPYAPPSAPTYDESTSTIVLPLSNPTTGRGGGFGTDNGKR